MHIIYHKKMDRDDMTRIYHYITNHQPEMMNPYGNFFKESENCAVCIGMCTNFGFYWTCDVIKCQSKSEGKECGIEMDIKRLDNTCTGLDITPYLSLVLKSGYKFDGWDNQAFNENTCQCNVK
jgi:hypothetical protein